MCLCVRNTHSVLAVWIAMLFMYTQHEHGELQSQRPHVTYMHTL